MSFFSDDEYVRKCLVSNRVHSAVCLAILCSHCVNACIFRAQKRVLWGPMGSNGANGVPWGPMGSHGVPWVPMGSHGVPWGPMGSHGVPWGPMGSHGIPMASMENPRMSEIMDSHETHYSVRQNVGSTGSISIRNVFPLHPVTSKRPESPYGATYYFF